MAEEVYRKACSFLETDSHSELQDLIQGLPANERASLLATPLLFEAIDLEADECARLLLEEHPESAQLSGGVALGAAASRGKVDFVRRLLVLNADPNQPHWEHDSDWNTLLSGSMQSMHVEIVSMACSEENFSQLDVNWVNDALEFGLSSRKKSALACLEIVARALLLRLEAGGLSGLKQGNLKKLSKKLIRNKAAALASVRAGQALASFIDARAAARDRLTELAFEREFEQLLEYLDEQPREIRDDLSPDLLAEISWCSADASDTDPEEGWWAFEKLLESGVLTNGVDVKGRTALMNIVWNTSGKESLIRKMVDLGADLNATVVEENGEVNSVLDFALLGYEVEKYGELLRSLGAKSAAELTGSESSKESV